MLRSNAALSRRGRGRLGSSTRVRRSRSLAGGALEAVADSRFNGFHLVRTRRASPNLSSFARAGKRLRPPRERLERRAPRSPSFRATLSFEGVGVVNRRFKIAAYFGHDREAIIGRLRRVRRDAFAEGALAAAPAPSAAAATAALALLGRSDFFATASPRSSSSAELHPQRAPRSPRRPPLQSAPARRRSWRSRPAPGGVGSTSPLTPVAGSPRSIAW